MMALALQIGGYSIAQIAIFIVITAAIVALVWVAMKGMGVTPPGWAVQAFWIVIIALVVIFAIKIVAGMG